MKNINNANKNNDFFIKVSSLVLLPRITQRNEHEIHVKHIFTID